MLKKQKKFAKKYGNGKEVGENTCMYRCTDFPTCVCKYAYTCLCARVLTYALSAQVGDLDEIKLFFAPADTHG